MLLIPQHYALFHLTLESFPSGIYKIFHFELTVKHRWSIYPAVLINSKQAYIPVQLKSSTKELCTLTSVLERVASQKCSFWVIFSIL